MININSFKEFSREALELTKTQELTRQQEQIAKIKEYEAHIEQFIQWLGFPDAKAMYDDFAVLLPSSAFGQGIGNVCECLIRYFTPLVRLSLLSFPGCNLP